MKSGLKDKNKREIRLGDLVFWLERVPQYDQPTKEEEDAHYKRYQDISAVGFSGVFGGPVGKRLPDKIIGHSAKVEFGFYDDNEGYGTYEHYGWYLKGLNKDKGLRETLADMYKKIQVIIKRKK